MIMPMITAAMMSSGVNVPTVSANGPRVKNVAGAFAGTTGVNGVLDTTGATDIADVCCGVSEGFSVFLTSSFSSDILLPFPPTALSPKPAAKGETKMNDNDLNNSDSFTPARVGALFESLKGEIHIVAEGQIDLRKKVDDVRVNQAHMLERFTGMEIRITKVETSLNKLEFSMNNRFDSLDNRVGRLETVKG